MEKKYSKVYTVEDKDFRYNYEDALVEFIYIDEDETMVIDAIGLSDEGWKNDKEGYLWVYANDLEYEMQSLMQNAEFEFGL